MFKPTTTPEQYSKLAQIEASGLIIEDIKIRNIRVEHPRRISTVFLVLALAIFGGTEAIAEEIQYQEKVSLETGQSEIIHGARGECGQAAPNWEKVASSLPSVSTGEFSDGGLGVRWSRRCGGLTPARAVRFTATQPGHEQIELYDDPIDIEVK